MSLSKAIEFRYLASQLTSTEIRIFVNKLVNIKTDIILKSLFNHLKSSQNLYFVNYNLLNDSNDEMIKNPNYFQMY